MRTSPEFDIDTHHRFQAHHKAATALYRQSCTGYKQSTIQLFQRLQENVRPEGKEIYLQLQRHIQELEDESKTHDNNSDEQEEYDLKLLTAPKEQYDQLPNSVLKEIIAYASNPDELDCFRFHSISNRYFVHLAKEELRLRKEQRKPFRGDYGDLLDETLQEIVDSGDHYGIYRTGEQFFLVSEARKELNHRNEIRPRWLNEESYYNHKRPKLRGGLGSTCCVTQDYKEMYGRF